jgi:hypothetical protein
MLSSSATLESRLHQQQRKVDDKKRSIAKKRDDLADENRRALQAEAETIELTKELEVLELQLADHRRQIEARLLHLNREEDSIVALELRANEDLRTSQEKHGNAQLELDAGWRRIDEAVQAHDSHVAAEQARIRRMLHDSEHRYTALKEKQRHIVDRETAVASRERGLDMCAATLRDFDRQALDRMQNELRSREELFESHKTDMRAAQNSPRRVGQ